MKDRRVVLRPVAQADVIEIAAHSFATWGQRQMERYVNGLSVCMDGLRRFPNRAARVLGEGSEYRGVRYGRHVVFYRVTDGEIIVVRILHERQDPLLHLGPE